MNNNCQFIKPDKTQCKSHPIKGEAYCFTHHPEYKQKHKEAVLRGGQSPKKHYEVEGVITVRRSQDVVVLIEKTINDLRQNKISVKMANSIALLSGVAMRAFEQHKKDEVDDFISGKGDYPY